MTTMTNITEENKRKVRNHSNRNIAYILDRLGVDFNDRGDGLIQACCPCEQHGGDRNNSTAFSWRLDLGKWVCWTHHCEESFGNDIFGLVASIKKLNFRDAVKWLMVQLESKDINISESIADPENLHRGTQLHVHEPLSEDNLKFLQPDPQYLLNRGFDLEVLRTFEAGLWQRPGTFMHDRVVFPIRDHEGYLVGYTGRTIHPKEYFEKRGLQYVKWIHGRHYNRWPQRGDLFTSSILFNLNRAKKHLEPHKRLILVEGPLDIVRLWEAGIYNCAATLGTNFCHSHRTLLVKAGITDLFNAYDADDPTKYKDNQSPGEKGWQRMHRVVGDLFNLHKVDLPAGHDCGDLPIETLQEIFKDIHA